MGWVISAGVSILSLTLKIDRWPAMLVCLGIIAIYVMLSGLWGVVATNFFQFGKGVRP